MRSGRHRRDFQAAKASGPGVSVRGASRGTATGHRAAVFSEKRRWRSRTRPRRGQPTSRRNRKRTRESPRPGKCYCSSGHKQRSAGIAGLLPSILPSRFVPAIDQRVSSNVCNAIAYAHSRGVLHRDLKPGNMMLGKYGETLVVDWGLAKPLDRIEEGTAPGEAPLRPALAGGSVETLPGAALGTPQYMSPEQAAGRLEVRTEAVAGNGRGPGDWVRLSVQDNGEGIPEELQGRIFDAFFSTKERGTGLGLAMVRQIVEGFGGHVEVSSRPGAGARFDVWLPREGAGAPA